MSLNRYPELSNDRTQFKFLNMFKFNSQKTFNRRQSSLDFTYSSILLLFKLHKIDYHNFRNSHLKTVKIN